MRFPKDAGQCSPRRPSEQASSGGIDRAPRDAPRGEAPRGIPRCEVDPDTRAANEVRGGSIGPSLEGNLKHRHCSPTSDQDKCSETNIVILRFAFSLLYVKATQTPISIGIQHSSVGKALASDPKGRWFDSAPPRHPFFKLKAALRRRSRVLFALAARRRVKHPWLQCQ